MSKRPFIIIGCKTDHGGTVVEGAPTTFHYGIPISRIGDAVPCPIPGHGGAVIATGDPSCIIDGKPAARHGDKTTCGATLLMRQSPSVD